MAETTLPLQSPIDLDEATPIPLAIPALGYELAWDTLRSGDYDARENRIDFRDSRARMSVTIPGRPAPTEFTLAQFHFHSDPEDHLGEHKVGGRRWPLELHVVHTAEEPDPSHAGRTRTIYAVLAIMFRAGEGNAEANEFFLDLTRKHPAAAGKGPGGTEPTIPLDPRSLLPADPQGHFRYEGSLTTKVDEPNDGYVSWVVLNGPAELRADVLDGYRRQLGHKSKSLQPLGRRYVFFYPPGPSPGAA